jgi:hypothetical protein
MKLNRTLQSTILAASLLGGVAMVAAQVNPARHPHLAAAQHHGQEAFRELSEAQAANNNQLGGHAQRAKELLEQANHELDLAVQESNRNGH